MKVVHLLGWYFPDSVGGTETYVARLARLQRARGCEVQVAAPSARLREPLAYAHEDVPVFRYPVPAAPTREEAQSAVPVNGGRYVIDWVARERPDIVHVHSLVPGISLHELTALRPIVAGLIVTNHLPSLAYHCLRGNLMRGGVSPCDGTVTIDGCAACALESRGASPWLAAALGSTPTWIGRLATPRLFGRAGTALRMPLYVEQAIARQSALLALVDRFVVLNEWARRCLLAGGAPAEKICLNRLGVDVDQVAVPVGAAARADDRPRTFGYIGRFDPDKGVIQLLEAFLALPSDARCRLRLIGPQSAETSSTAERLRRMACGDPRISIEPSVPVTEVAARLAEFDVLCCPSIGFENGPTIALEALAVGTPVVGTRVGGLPEIVRDGVDGALVDPLDVPALTAVMHDILADPAIVMRWRQGMRPVRTMTDVELEYDQVYARAIDDFGGRARSH